MRHDVLDVIIPYSNPMRWKSRERLFLKCVEEMVHTRGVRLTVVMQSHGNHSHDLTLPAAAHVIHVPGASLLWTKEGLINAGVQRLPHDWKYVCWLDGDIHFRDPSWATESIHFLGHWPIIQPWSKCIDLGPNGEIIKVHSSFAYQLRHSPHTCTKMGAHGYEMAHPGFAWACTRYAWETFGGLMDFCILGAADHHQALAMIGKADYSIKKGIHPHYRDAVLRWEKLVCKLGKKIYYVPASVIEHGYHGAKTGKLGRKYVERWDILIKNNFDPLNDIRYNYAGIPELVGNKPELERAIWEYHSGREEDLNILLD